MKILFFTKYTSKGASSRMRTYQYIPYLQKEGLDISVSPLFSDAYLDYLYSNKRVLKKEVLKSYFIRFFKLFTIYKYDGIVIEKELFPYIPPVFEWLMHFFKVKYIVNYDDAIFHNYDQKNNFIFRFFLKNKIRKVMQYSALVVAGNSYLAKYAEQSGAICVEIIPTVIDITRYNVKTDFSKDDVVIGWIGSPSSFKYLKLIEGTLKRLADKYNVKVYIVGSKQPLGLGKNEAHIDWSLDTEVESILKFDIGVMPLINNMWEQGKCSYKLIQYMACGIPGVASPVGMNCEVISHERNGYLAENDDDWFSYLEELICDKNKRKQFGLDARKAVESKYTLQVTSEKYLKLIKKIFN